MRRKRAGEPHGRGDAAVRQEAHGQEGVQRGVGLPTDPNSRIAKMKDGTTHLAYKAEHVVDLDSDLVLAAEVYHADQADCRPCGQHDGAQINLAREGQRSGRSRKWRSRRQEIVWSRWDSLGKIF